MSEHVKIVINDELKDSKRSIRFRDTTPLLNYMCAVCAVPEENGEIRFDTPLEVKWYQGRGETVRCIVWFRDRINHRYQYGVGSAAGWGYNKSYSAFRSALREIGISAASSSGGEYSPDIVVLAVAEALGYKHIKVVEGYA